SLGSGYDSDVHTTYAVNLVHIDFMEHRLFGQTESVVAIAIELAIAQAAEVADTRQCQGDQAVNEFPHAIVTQGGVGTNWHAFAQLELCDRLASLGDHWLLTGNCGQIAYGAFNELRVLGCFANTHVHDNLGQGWYLHWVGVVELLLQSRADVSCVLSLQTWLDLGGCFSHYRSFPEALA